MYKGKSRWLFLLHRLLLIAPTFPALFSFLFLITKRSLWVGNFDTFNEHWLFSPFVCKLYFKIKINTACSLSPSRLLSKKDDRALQFISWTYCIRIVRNSTWSNRISFWLYKEKLILSNATVHYTNNKSNKKKNTVTFSMFRTVTLWRIHSRRTVGTSYMIHYRNHKWGTYRKNRWYRWQNTNVQ